ncbi:hypothetical protein N5B56_05375 [Eubacterium sp. LFL-14]|uniref:Preprotein translocase subunit SecB n=1 Tax=Eubacterium album TaxID=2978477 RepID=A0ABT2LYZ3_9FIRM|nr:hypothetical protein [Eubacterium sp. LFL-14]MCT7398516.1 hypothetical protein [Eubacterium sp. LFL-14]
MGELVFRGIQVNEIDMSNELQGQVKLDIEQRASFNVKYTQDMKHCIATCVVDMMNKNAPNDFNFKISVRASFDIEGEMEKKEVHKKAYDEMYPHMRALTMSVLTTAGMPPIVIPKIKMDENNIKVELGNKKEEEKFYS